MFTNSNFNIWRKIVIKNILVTAALFTILSLSASEDIKISVSSQPELPVKNILQNNTNFEKDFKGWTIPEKSADKVLIVEDKEKSGKSLKLMEKGYVYCGISPEIIEVGKSYILSCMIKPDKQVTTANSGPSGLGCSLTFWKAGYKSAVTWMAIGSGAEKWQKVVSKPVMATEDLSVGQLTAALRYTPGTGLIDDILFAEAYAKIAVRVTSKIEIRQIKITNDLNKTIFDTGILETPVKTFDKELEVETLYTYTIMVVANDGDVQSIVYPATQKLRDSEN